MKNGLVTLLILSMICSPIIAQQEITNEHQAFTDAMRDAKQTDTNIWALAGCFGGVPGIIVAYAMTPSVPPVRLLGKSPEYVAYYTSTYQAEVRNERTKSAVGGCIASGLAYTGFYVLVMMNSNYYY